MRDLVSNFVRFLASMLVKCEKACELLVSFLVRNLVSNLVRNPVRNFVRNLVRNLVTNLVKRTTSQDSHRILKGPLGVPTRFSRRISTDSHRILTEFSQDSHRILTGFSQDSRNCLASSQEFDREPHSILTGCSASPQIFSQRTSQDSHRKTDLSALQSFQGYHLTTLEHLYTYTLQVCVRTVQGCYNEVCLGT